jgi:hypothetical protein
MYTVFKITGFKYREANDGNKYLMETEAITAARIKFLTFEFQEINTLYMS